MNLKLTNVLLLLLLLLFFFSFLLFSLVIWFSLVSVFSCYCFPIGTHLNSIKDVFPLSL